MDKKVILYRGDSSEIDKFKVNKTSKYGLVGQGVYLTTSQVVADSYRTKGQDYKVAFHNYETEQLWEGHALNRLEAFNFAFPAFLHFHTLCNRLNSNLCLDDYYFEKNKNGKVDAQKEKALNKAKQVYQTLIEEGKIKASYVCRVGKKTIRVTYHHGMKTGYRTSFCFNEKDINNHTVLIDKISDPAIWELFWDNNIEYGTKQISKEEYIEFNKNRYIRLNRQNPEVFKIIRKILEPYGFKGFSYRGGLYIGGYGNHNAFCIWDEDWVNDYKITTKA